MKKRVIAGVLILAGCTGTSSAQRWYFAGDGQWSDTVTMTYSDTTGDEYTITSNLRAPDTKSPTTVTMPAGNGLTCGMRGISGNGAAFWLDFEQGSIPHVTTNQQVDLFTQNSAVPGYTSIQSDDGSATMMFELNTGTAGSYSLHYADNTSGNYELKSGPNVYGTCGEIYPHYLTLLMKKTTAIKPGYYKFSVPLVYRITYDAVGTSPLHQFGIYTVAVNVNNTCNASVGSLVYAFDKTNLHSPQKKSTSLSVTCDDPDTPLKFRIMAGDGSAMQTAADGSVVMAGIDGLKGTMQVSVDHGGSTPINSSQWSNEIGASTVSGLTSVMSIDPDTKAGTYRQTYQIQVAYD